MTAHPETGGDAVRVALDEPIRDLWRRAEKGAAEAKWWREHLSGMERYSEQQRASVRRRIANHDRCAASFSTGAELLAAVEQARKER